MDDAKKQKNARMFIAEYFHQLTTQERIVQKIVDKKWEEMSSKIDGIIDRKIQERLQWNYLEKNKWAE